MNRVVLESITTELTAAQRLAHNKNYSKLADKDMELFDEMRIRIEAAFYENRVNDLVLGTRSALDPDNTSLEEGNIYAGYLIEWLNKFSTRIITIWEMLTNHLAETTTGYSVSGYSQSSLGIPNGVDMGVVSSNEGHIFMPIAITILPEQELATNYFFRVAESISLEDGIGINLSYYDGTESEFVNGNVGLLNSDNTVVKSLDAGTLYIFTAFVDKGEVKVYLREAAEGDFII